MTDINTAQSDSPTALLRALGARAARIQRPLPQGDVGGTHPRFIAFRIAGTELATPMTEIQEILNYPDLSPVPGAKRWLKGIAQVRGRLMSIIDFQDFLGGGVTALRRTTRVLLAEQGDLLCGFMVDEVMGMKQHLPPVGDITEPSQAPSWLQDSLGEAVYLDNRAWTVLEFDTLMRMPAFLQAAA